MSMYSNEPSDIPPLLLESCQEWKKFCTYHRVFIWDYINEENYSKMKYDDIKIEYLLSEMEYQLRSSKQFAMFIKNIQNISRDNLIRMMNNPFFEKLRIETNQEVLDFVENIKNAYNDDMLQIFQEKLFRKTPPFSKTETFEKKSDIMRFIDDTFISSSSAAGLEFILEKQLSEEMIIFSLNYYLEKSPDFERITEIIVCMTDKDFRLLFIYLKWLLKNDVSTGRFNVLYLMESGIDEDMFNYLKEISF